MDFCLGEATLGVCEQLMDGEATLQAVQMMCSPITFCGYGEWHRDMNSFRVAPLEGLAMDVQVNGHAYLQWNIPLYDDDVLWIVPGSHLRAATDVEKRQLLTDPRVPLPGALQVDLKAGDAVVYTNIMLHWGSHYTTKLRRTVHLSYRSFGGQLFPHAALPHWDFDFGFAERLSPTARAVMTHVRDLYAQERDDIESFMRAILARNEAAFRELLDKLHPGKEGKMVALILLSPWAKSITSIVRGGPGDGPFYADVADRFTEQEGQELEQRFAGLQTQLAADREAAHARLREEFRGLEPIPGDLSSFNFDRRSTSCFYSEMPAEFGLDQFVASWNGQ
jgi:hypothetical protein